MLLAICILLAPMADTEIKEDLGRYYELELATNPTIESYYQAGMQRLARGDLEMSIRLLERVRHARPEAHYYLGVAYYRIGDYDRAAHNFRELSRRDSEVWHQWYYLSLISLKQNDLDRAMRYLQMMPESECRTTLEQHILDYQLLTEARSRFARDDYDRAAELYGQVRGFFGHRELGLALTYAKMGKHDESLALLDTLISHDPDRALVLQSLFESGLQHVRLRNMDTAKEQVRKYLKIEQNDDAKFLLGKIFSEEMAFDSAYVYFRDLPDTVDGFLFYKGRTEYFLGEWGKAEAKLLLHRERFPSSPFSDRALYILASINFKRGEYSEAISYWRALVDQFPGSIYAASALAGVGDAHFHLGDYSKALVSYKQVEQFNPSEILASELSLKIYETEYYQHKYPSLVVALRTYIRDNPRSNLVARTNLRIARLYFEARRFYESMNELDKIIEIYPNSLFAVEALILRVQVSQAIDNRDEQLNSLRSLLLNDNAAEYRLYAANELGAFWISQSDYDSALYYYNMLLDSGAYRENAILKIAKIYDQIGQTKEAIAMVDLLVSQYPGSVYLTDAHILRSRALRRQGDYEAAARVLEQIMKKVGDRADLHMEMGNLYFETEEFSSARQHFLKACELFKQNREDAANALLLAGDASVRIGDKTGGKEYYLQANMIAESAFLKNQAMQRLSALGEE